MQYLNMAACGNVVLFLAGLSFHKFKIAFHEEPWVVRHCSYVSMYILLRGKIYMFPRWRYRKLNHPSFLR